MTPGAGPAAILHRRSWPIKTTDPDRRDALRQQGSGPWQARHGLTAAGYQQAFDNLRNQGFMPVQVAGYGHGF
jgi:Bacterial tandem repeat domain 1